MLRGVLLLVGAGGIIWALAALPSFQLTTPARDITARIMADQRFTPGTLQNALSRMTAAQMPSIVQSEFVRAEALIRLRNAEEKQRKSPEEADREVETAENNITASLSTNPSDSFLWLLLYSLKMARSGFDPSHAKYLIQSYKVGPYEGWVSLRRNRLALATLPMLSEAAQEYVVAEFATLVDSDFIEDAALTLMTVGWAHRERLAASLAGADIASREGLAKRLSSNAVKISIPGIETEVRPWK